MPFPAKKIIKARRTPGGEFDRWRQHVDALGAALTEQLQQIQDPAVAQRTLHEAVRKYATQPLLRRVRAAFEVDDSKLRHSVPDHGPHIRTLHWNLMGNLDVKLPAWLC